MAGEKAEASKTLATLRILSALLFGTATLTALWYHPALWLLFLLSCLGVAASEWAELTALPTALSVLIFVPAALLAGFELYYLLPIFLIPAAFPMLWRGNIQPADYTIDVAAGLIWLSIPVALLFRLRLQFGFRVVLGLILGTSLQDTAAYYSGLWLGLGEDFSGEVSPNKTWSGFFGGGVAFVTLFLSFGYWEFWALPVGYSLVLALLLSCVSPAGDLMISGLKRRADLEDTGFILPGHGGMLDRVDGLLVNVVVVYGFLSLVGELV